jgi:hypothetical protein
MLISAYILFFEVVVLEIFLIRVAYRHKKKIGGSIAASLIIPIGYYMYAYLNVDYVSLLESRIIVRYGQAVLFLILNIIFIRLSRKGT